MANPQIKLKRSATQNKRPTPDNIPLGELAINTYDGYLYASKDVGAGTTIITINPWRVGTGTDSFNIDFTAGNVGINSSIPTALLDVNGDVNISGVITATSFSGSGAALSGVVTSIVAGSNITLTGGPTGAITIAASGGGGSNNVTTRSTSRFVATAAQSAFSKSYTVGYVDVFLNGSKLDGTEYAATNGSSVSLTTAAAADDIVEIVAYETVGITSISSAGQGFDVTGHLETDTLNISGIVTARSGIRVLTGTATTALVVEGNARVTGILTVGSSSLTLDGTNNIVNVGTALTLGHTQGLQFHTQNLHATGFEINNINASGIVTATGGIDAIGIQSGGVNISTGIITALNFIGAGNTFAVNGNVVDISIAGGGGGGGIDAIGIQSAGTLVGTATTINFGSGATITNNVASVSVGSTTRFVGARMYHNDYSVTASGSWTSVTGYDGITLDTNSFANATNGRFTIPAGVSKIKLSTNVRAIANGNTNNQWMIYKNGGTVDPTAGGFNIDIDGTSGYNNPGAFGQTAVLEVVEGDYFILSYFVSSTNLDVDAWYQIEVVEGDILGTYFSANNIVDDTTPQLGGNLDLNGKNITGTGNANITGVVTATTFSGSGASLTSIPAANITGTLPAISGVNLTGVVTSITAGSNITLTGGPTGAITIAASGGGGGGGDTVSIESSATDILSVSSGAISADDAGADKLVFWDDSAGKLTYLTVGSNLTVTNTTIAASGGGGGGGGGSNGFAVIAGMIF